MTVADVITLTERINLFSTITSNYVSEDEKIEKPRIVIRGATTSDIELERCEVTDNVIYALYNDLVELRKKYEYIAKVMKEEFKFEIEDLVEKYSTEKYLSDFKNALNASREKENGASLTFVIVEDSEKEKQDTSMCTIKLKDIFEKNENYLVIEDLINNYSKKVNTPHYIQAVNWLKNHDLETLEVPEEIAKQVESMAGKIEKENKVEGITFEEIEKVEGEPIMKEVEEEEVVTLKPNANGSFS